MVASQHIAASRSVWVASSMACCGPGKFCLILETQNYPRKSNWHLPHQKTLPIPEGAWTSDLTEQPKFDKKRPEAERLVASAAAPFLWSFWLIPLFPVFPQGNNLVQQIESLPCPELHLPMSIELNSSKSNLEYIIGKYQLKIWFHT